MTTHPRDIVVIGCSAGGVEALPRIAQQLPPDLEATVLIVQHLAPTGTPYLVSILERAAQLPVGWAEQGARIERRRIIVAPPDVHLVVADRHVQLTKGARENHARPSINKLFRSAAADYGSRVVGVLLTGMLEDGVAGLQAIRAVGGVVIVQDPLDAAFPELPTRALQVLAPDRTLPIDAIGPAVVALVGDDVTVVTPPEHVALEAQIDRQPVARPGELSSLGPQTSLACPDCHGPMWQVGDEALRRYRCYLGHVATASEMLNASAAEVDSALWSAVRALNDRATTLETLRDDASRIGNGQSAASYESRARETRQQVEIARQFVLELSRPR
jgi:two-component system, chemotaxis family, protein-glutamate methylesterase/glutaminase